MVTAKTKKIRIKNLAAYPEYVPLISRWLWKEWGRDDGRDIKDVVYRTRHCLQKKNVPMTFIAFYDKKPVGTFSLWMNDLKSRQDLTPWLAVLYVIPKMRGKGIGTLMQQSAITQAKALHYKSLYLITDHIDYYEKSGWKFLEKAPLPSGKKTRIYTYQLKK